jgi:hypothetical protein
MKKKKLIYIEEDYIKKIEKIQKNKGIKSFSETIIFLINNYENRLSNHIVRDTENITLLNTYLLLKQQNPKLTIKNMLEIVYKNLKIIEEEKKKIMLDKKSKK